MHRDEAIVLLAKDYIKHRSNRLKLIEYLRVDGWDLSEWTFDDFIKDVEKNDDDPSSALILKNDLFENFKTGDFSDVMEAKYGELLIAESIPAYGFWANEYLLEKVNALNYDVETIEGEIANVFSCPCCGRDSLPERHGWDICPICWWEDDGTDNVEASLYYSGPNKGLQLTEGRINFLIFGIYNPNRNDLMENRAPVEMFNQSRFFEIDKDKKIIFERNSDWWAPLAPPHLKDGETKPKVSLAGASMRDWPPFPDEE